MKTKKTLINIFCMHKISRLDNTIVANLFILCEGFLHFVLIYSTKLTYQRLTNFVTSFFILLVCIVSHLLAFWDSLLILLWVAWSWGSHQLAIARCLKVENIESKSIANIMNKRLEKLFKISRKGIDSINTKADKGKGTNKLF